MTDSQKLERYENLLTFARDNQHSLKGMDSIVEMLTGEAVPIFLPLFSKEELRRFREIDKVKVPIESEFGGVG